MYEYRHMKIGSAAQYHHSSDEYRYLVSNLSFTGSIKFLLGIILFKFWSHWIIYWSLWCFYYLSTQSELFNRYFYIFFSNVIYTF